MKGGSSAWNRPSRSRRGLGPATALATALCSLVLASCDLLVTTDPCTLELTVRVSQAEVALRVGQTRRVGVTASACGGRDSSGVDMRWSSSDATVARVDPVSGEITAIAVGRATVTGQDRGPSRAGRVEVGVRVTDGAGR